MPEQTPTAPTTVTVELPQKGELNSQTIRNILYSILAFFATQGMDWLTNNSQQVQQWIMALTPDIFDPLVPSMWNWLYGLLVLYFGRKAISGRKAVGDIQGLYKKQ